MQSRDFFNRLKAGDLKSVYQFAGQEEYIKREALSALRAKLLPAGLEQLNEAVMENVSARDILDSADTLPVMCERRLVVVRDWAPLLNGKAKNEEKDVELFTQWLEHPPESCVVVFYMTKEPDGRKKLNTLLKKQELTVDFAYLGDADMARWCNKALKAEGKQISPEALNTLTLMAGYDLSRIRGELDKLTGYAGERAEILPEDVRAVVSPSPEYTSFLILEQMLDRNLAGAKAALNQMLQNGMQAAQLIGMFAGQMRINLHVRLAMDKRRDMAEVSRMLGFKNQYRIKFVSQRVRAHSAEDLRYVFEQCLQTEYQIKTGRLRDRAAIDQLLLNVVRRDATNSSRAASKL